MIHVSMCRPSLIDTNCFRDCIDDEVDVDDDERRTASPLDDFVPTSPSSAVQDASSEDRPGFMAAFGSSECDSVGIRVL